MSDYSDVYYELHKTEFEKERLATEYRRRLVSELSVNDMVKIMFSSHVESTKDYIILDLAEKYLID